MSSPRQHLPEVDGLRALAILPVLVSNLWSYPAGHWFNRFAAAGWMGIDLLFILTGFLITRTLLSTRDRPDYYRAFYWRRVRRSVPAYYLTLIAVLVALPLVSHSDALANARHAWPWFVGFASNVWLAQHGYQLFAVDITWVVAVGAQFYLVWPVVVRSLSRKQLQWVSAALLVACPLARWALAPSVGHTWLELMLPFRFDSLAAGALIAVSEPAVTGLTDSMRRRFAIATAALVTAIIATVSFGVFEQTTFMVLSTGHSVMALAGMGALVARWRPLSWAPLRSISRVSLGLYLYHPIVVMVISAAFAVLGRSLTGAANILVVGPATYVAAFISYRWIEMPVFRWSPQRAADDSFDAGETL